MSSSNPDFSAAHAVLQRHIDTGFLSGVSCATLRDGQLVDSVCLGFSDVEQQLPMRADLIHRAFSNTKLITSVTALLLVDQGLLSLESPIKQWIPAFGALRVLRPSATSLQDTEPLHSDITVRQLLSHQAGFSHGVFDAGSLIFNAYIAAGLRKPDTTLAEAMNLLAALPLIYQPGQGWEYSMATDVMARVIEVVTGLRYDEALQKVLLGPLGMVDTGFVMRPNQMPRMLPLYVGDIADPSRPGIRRLDDVPFPDAFRKPVPRQSGAGGLFTTQADMLRLVAQLVPGHGTLLKPQTLQEMQRDQLPASRHVGFPFCGPLPHLGFGLGGAITRHAAAREPNSPAGEFQWGGLAGTHWWVSPATGVAGVLMTQRFWGFWNPFWFEYKACVYDALA